MKKRKWDFLLTQDERKTAAREIATYFENEFEQELGIIATEDLLDFMLDIIWWHIYNKAIEDSRTTMRENFGNLDVTISSLLRS